MRRQNRCITLFGALGPLFVEKDVVHSFWLCACPLLAPTPTQMENDENEIHRKPDRWLSTLFLVLEVNSLSSIVVKS